MSIVSLIVVLVVVGAILYCINTLVPMDARVKSVINVIILVAVLIWLLQAVGLLSGHAFRLT